jgi:hypothetical protein
MTYVMTKPCPVCRQQQIITGRGPSDIVHDAFAKHVGQG